MPVTLETTLAKVAREVKDKANVALLCEFDQYLKTNGVSESYRNSTPKMLIAYADCLPADTSFHDVSKKERHRLDPELGSVYSLYYAAHL